MEWPKEFEGHSFEFYGHEGLFTLKICDNQIPKRAATHAASTSADGCIREGLRKLKLDRDDPEIVADEQAAVKKILDADKQREIAYVKLRREYISQQEKLGGDEI